ncbi:hypothetical protein DL769_011703 [Monosporascus sp. CRB-8-3]|nr:hypothetical protein DL769_011703 [Monosporascus sp. CRB-8-3]
MPNGVLNETRVKELYYDAPSRYEGCSGSRCLSDNIPDLKAQIAANARSISVTKGLVGEYGLGTAEVYDLRQPTGGVLLEAVNDMNTSRLVKLKITIAKGDSAVLGFAGSGEEVHGNFNALEANTYSAIIYSLWCMINSDVPLNQRCLSPSTWRFRNRVS